MYTLLVAYVLVQHTQTMYACNRELREHVATLKVGDGSVVGVQ